MNRLHSMALASCVSVCFFLSTAQAADPEIQEVNRAGDRIEVKVKSEDNANVLRILTSSNLLSWLTNTSSSLPGTNSPLVGHLWTNVLPAVPWFVRAEVQPISAPRQLAAHVLNRLAYGHTPYELGRILGFKTNIAGADTMVDFGEGVADGGIGVDAWIAEQLNPAAIVEDVTNQFTAIAPIYARFGTLATVILTNQPGSNETNQPGTLNFHDFRAWYALHCVGARRQFLEVMLYWCENHFASSFSQARSTFEGSYEAVGGDIDDRIPTKMEAEEHRAYRAALLNPAVTFRDLLRLQHESASMTVFLDTNDSVGGGNNVAGTAYTRALLEHFSMGATNGHDEGDVIALSLAWTGWDVQKVAVADAGNLFAFQDGSLMGQSRTNSQGVYALQFRNTRHGQSNLFLWYHRDSVGALSNNYPNGQVVAGPGGFKRVPARFNGSGMTPAYNFANKNYGTNTGNEGRYSLYIHNTTNLTAQRPLMVNKVYTVLDHLADLPFTQEHISVKLCQLLVHDDFATGYDFNDGLVTPEEQLVWNCLMAWETNAPKGQLYKVVQAITDSALFRSSSAYRRKLKTPLEFTMSAVRALRLATNEVYAADNFSTDTTGYAIVSGVIARTLQHPLNRMGYLIFDSEQPAGHAERGSRYADPNTLIERARWINSVMYPTYNVVSDTVSGGNRTRFHLRGVMDRFLSASAQNDADQVVQLFLRLLFPGEGETNLDGYRRLGLSLLNQTSTGTTSAWTGVDAQKNDRVPRMVGALMSLQRFQEQ
jgi:uncharacterized protein (DUF1800 family)